MKVRFNIEYRTVYGENLVLNILDKADADHVASHAMKPASEKSWKCDLDLPARAASSTTSTVCSVMARRIVKSGQSFLTVWT